MLRPGRWLALLVDPTLRRPGNVPWSFHPGGHPPEMSTWLDAEWAIERRRFFPCRDDEVTSCNTEYIQDFTD